MSASGGFHVVASLGSHFGYLDFFGMVCCDHSRYLTRFGVCYRSCCRCFSGGDYRSV